MILSTLDPVHKYYGRLAFRYVIFTMFTAFFGAVYEYFSFGVYSSYMLYAFAFPLVGGVFVFSGLCLSEGEKRLGKTGLRVYHYGIITLTVGSLVSGVVEIYGTTNRLTSVYWMVGILFLVTGAVMAVFRKSPDIADRKSRG